jgi:proteasome lid subunit RPN8/RPN11
MEEMKKVHFSKVLYDQICSHGEGTYPYEGAGLMLGLEEEDGRYVKQLIFLENAKDRSEQHNRYLITAEDMLQAELKAAKQDLTILGIFHSHPDHPNLPSEYDREFAIPWYSYLITSINQGKASGSRSWRLEDDRKSFQEEKVIIS